MSVPPPADPDRTVAVATGRPAPGGDDDATRLRTQATVPTAEASSNVLATGTRLAEFELLSVIGEGGFGIVYRARDLQLQRTVAVKEYMPSALAARRADASVVVKSDQHRETFAIGLKSFINEARLLAQFDHPALVKVYRFWEANGTAYMAMPLYEGGNLKQALKARSAPPDEAWLRRLLVPLLDAVELLHRSDCLHRDIAPDNVLLVGGDRPEVKPLLLDFGAARRVLGAQTQALTVILKPGYAPIEQYDEIPGMKQGPWTDLYALGALMHFAIIGKPPPPSVGRLVRDGYQPLSQVAQGRYSERFLAAIDAALAARPEARPQSVAEFRQLLSTSPRAAAGQGGRPPVTAVPAAVIKPPLRWGRALALGVAFAGLLVGGGWLVLSLMNAAGERRLAEVARAAKAAQAVRLEASATAAAAPPSPAPPAEAPVVVAATPAGQLPPPRPTEPAARAGIEPSPPGPTAPAAIEPRGGPASKGDARPVQKAESRPVQVVTSAPKVQPGATAVNAPPAAAVADARIDAALGQGRDCLAARDFACSIARAESVLKVEPNHAAAQALLKQARAAQEAALAGDWKMR